MTEYTGKDAFIDREYSWLSFNQRVLDEALDSGNPLLERIRFLAIVANNLDEFFEVRIAALLQKAESSVPVDGIAGLDTLQKLDTILKHCQRTMKQQYRCWNEELMPLLRQNNIIIRSVSELAKEEEKHLSTYFRREIYNLLTPIKVDPAHPFPWVLNKSLCVAVLLKEDTGKKRENLGVVTIPRSLPRFISLPTKDKGLHFLFLYDVVQHYIGELFKGYQIRHCAPFRITRNSNLYLEEEEGSSLIDVVEAVVHNRRKGNVVRLEIDRNAPKKIIDALVRNFDIESKLVFRVSGPVNLSRLSGLYNLVPLSALKYPSHIPSHPFHFQDDDDLFDEIKSHDILLHHPFDSFDPVVKFIQAAARDPRVLAIKQTLYRTNQDSPVMYALLEAAELGKEVVVVVELQARFDEKSNINWARQLEEKGGTVVYGLVGLKTHCKLSLIIRKEDEGFAQYVHIGTGNYHPETARHYTDLSFFTRDREITDGASEVFNFLTAQSKGPDFKSLLVGPINFLSETIRLIHRERDNARAGKPSGIMAKMNALLDRELMEALYEAAQAGVEIKLMVRGICSLRPGVPGLSENITVRSIVGRFLEHSRIFHFENAGNSTVFIGSGDWMERNLRDRVEVIMPLKDKELIGKVEEILSIYWADNTKARIMRADGTYIRPLSREGEDSLNAQELLMHRNEETPPVFKSIFRGRPAPTESIGPPPEKTEAEDLANPFMARPENEWVA